MDIEKDVCCFEEWGSILGEKRKKKKSGCRSLSPFGLATYKMLRRIWLNSSSDNEMISDLLSVADSWLKQLNVHHHDFNFFTQKFPLHGLCSCTNSLPSEVEVLETLTNWGYMSKRCIIPSSVNFVYVGGVVWSEFFPPNPFCGYATFLDSRL